MRFVGARGGIEPRGVLHVSTLLSSRWDFSGRFDKILKRV